MDFTVQINFTYIFVWFPALVAANFQIINFSRTFQVPLGLICKFKHFSNDIRNMLHEPSLTKISGIISHVKLSHVKPMCGIGTFHIRNFHIWNIHIWNYEIFTYEILICEIFTHEILCESRTHHIWNFTYEITLMKPKYVK